MGFPLGAAVNKEEYEEYLACDHWKAIRQEALEWYGFRCALCYRPQPPNILHVHHRTYERVGEEDLADLTVLCERCHNLFHLATDVGIKNE